MKFAIIGATGNVGRKSIDILEKSNLDIKELYLVASKNSLGKKIKFKGNELNVVALDSFLRCFFSIFFCNRTSCSKKSYICLFKIKIV